jgi:AAA+ superfamily predicted ATPase
VLNSFLQFVEADDSDSLILAATNQVEVLDPALFRRFDDVIRWRYPANQSRSQQTGNPATGDFPTRPIRFPRNA